MNNKTVCVDYGRDIAELAKGLLAQSAEIDNLRRDVASLQKRLEDSGALYGHTVAYAVHNAPGCVIKTYNTNTGEYI